MLVCLIHDSSGFLFFWNGDLSHPPPPPPNSPPRAHGQVRKSPPLIHPILFYTNVRVIKIISLMSRTIFMKIVIILPDLTRRFVNRGFCFGESSGNPITRPEPDHPKERSKPAKGEGNDNFYHIEVIDLPFHAIL